MGTDGGSGGGDGKLPRGNIHGLYPRNFAKTVSGYVDQDYLHKLSRAEKEWLSAFNDKHYGACFTGDLDTPKEARRESYRRKNAANADLYSIAQTRMGDLPSGLTRADEPDLSTSPGYLETTEYREALAAFRALLPRNSRTCVRDTPELQAARARLVNAKRGP